MEEKRNNRKLKGIENFQCNGDAVSTKSALVFRGRTLLKQTYVDYQLISEEEVRTNIEMPDDDFLMVIPRLALEGLTAAQEFLHFSEAGICVNNTEGGYSHNSREKIALLFIICNADLQKPLTNQFLVKDELKSIKKMSDLVDWISNMQNEKDVRRVLEREQPPMPTRPEPKAMEEPLLSKKQLADRFKISTKTIDRHPEQFKFTVLGCRKFYRPSDCEGYKKPGI